MPEHFAPSPPGTPSVSTIAVTASTSGQAAGTWPRPLADIASPLFPAAATGVTPAATSAQIAECSGSFAHDPMAPVAPKLMFATRIPSDCACAVTHSIPQMTSLVDPPPFAPSTFTAYNFVPGATPTTPLPLLRAPIVPAT